MAKGVVDGDSFIAGERTPGGVCEKNHVDVAPEVVLSACRRAPRPRFLVHQYQGMILRNQVPVRVPNRDCMEKAGARGRVYCI